MHQLFMHPKKAYDSRSLVQHLIEFVISTKLVSLIGVCLNKIQVAFAFPVKNGLIQGDAFIVIAFEYVIRKV